MSTQGASSQLEAAWRDIAAAWQTTCEDWRDAKSAEFEARFLENLPGLIGSARQAMEDIDILLRKMHHDCE